MGSSVTRSGGFSLQEERNLETEGPPPESSTRKPFFGYTSGFYTAEPKSAQQNA